MTCCWEENHKQKFKYYNRTASRWSVKSGIPPPTILGLLLLAIWISDRNIGIQSKVSKFTYNTQLGEVRFPLVFSNCKHTCKRQWDGQRNCSGLSAWENAKRCTSAMHIQNPYLGITSYCKRVLEYLWLMNRETERKKVKKLLCYIRHLRYTTLW